MELFTLFLASIGAITLVAGAIGWCLLLRGHEDGPRIVRYKDSMYHETKKRKR